MHLSGLVLDVYDDFRGYVLRSIFPSREDVPSLIKEGHDLSSEERRLLPDDVFALVLVDGQEYMRKFACTDPSNTALSVLYFIKNAHKLPEEAQTTAADNLSQACSWYGLEDLAKEAGLAGWAAKGALTHAAKNPLSTMQHALTAPSLIKGTQGEIQNRMGAVRHLEGNGVGVTTPEQINHVLGKQAELTGTYLMPLQGKDSRSPTPAKTVINKTGAMGRLVSSPAAEHHKDEGHLLPNLESVPGKNPEHAPQMRALKPHVDVSGKLAPMHMTEKKASRYALDGRYPLDSFAQVKTAVGYFDEYLSSFSPEERREYAQNTIKCAEALDIPVSETMQKYASESYAPRGEIKMALDSRRLLTDAHGAKILKLLQEKTAEVSPEVFCETLREFDRERGLERHYDSDVFDPYFSTYGTKVAAVRDNWSYIDGNVYLSAADLKQVVKTRVPSITQTFGEKFMDEFRKDPITIFESLPRDQKRMIASMTVDNNPGADLNP